MIDDNKPLNKNPLYWLFIRFMNFFRYIDWTILVCILCLMVYSLIVLYSVADGPALIEKQLLRIAIALSFLIFCSQIKPETYLKQSPWIYLFGFVLLILVLLLGVVSKGAQRWISLGPVAFQPSEIMKIGVPLMCAWIFVRRPLPPSVILVFFVSIVATVPAVMIFLQPDLGTALLVFAAGVMVILLSGLSYKVILACSILVMSCLPILWNFVMHDYQKRRVLTLFDPWQDPLGAGYHIIQSIIAIGSGGLFGKGWNQGSQTQLQFLPERSTDFIFAVIAEEFGFVGVCILLSLYFIILVRCMQLSLLATDSYARLVIASLSITFFFYVFVNIGMVSGFLPVVGIPLPLISYGGTSMLTLLIGFGIIMSLSKHKLKSRSA